MFIFIFLSFIFHEKKDDQPLSKERGWILENGEVAGAPRLSRTPAYSVGNFDFCFDYFFKKKKLIFLCF